MFDWSPKFNTGIELVDTQHQQLFRLLRELSERCRENTNDASVYDEALANLVEYAETHFRDEEQFMEEKALDEQHVRKHKMEHSSFTYDVTRMRNRVDDDEEAGDIAQRLVQFITSWLTYHILGTDQAMSNQIRAIDKGASAGEAFKTHGVAVHNPETTQLIIQSVMEMWRDASERCHRLQDQLAALQK